MLLIIEVAESSAGYDRKTKAPLYAAAKIPELWIVDLVQGVIEIFNQLASTAYQSKSNVARSETVISNAVSGLRIAATDMLGA